MKKTFAQRVRDAVRIDLAHLDEIPIAAIAECLDLVGDKEKRPLYRAVSDFTRRGELERVRPGVVRRMKREQINPAPKTACMWRLIRANRNGTTAVADLMANCGVSGRMAKEYLQMLVRRGLMRRIDRKGNRPSVYRLIEDPGPNLVRNDENAARLRRIREEKKNALAQLDRAGEALIAATHAMHRARMAVNDIKEGTNDDQG